MLFSKLTNIREGDRDADQEGSENQVVLGQRVAANQSGPVSIAN